MKEHNNKRFSPFKSTFKIEPVFQEVSNVSEIGRKWDSENLLQTKNEVKKSASSV